MRSEATLNVDFEMNNASRFKGSPIEKAFTRMKIYL